MSADLWREALVGLRASRLLASCADSELMPALADGLRATGHVLHIELSRQVLK